MERDTDRGTIMSSDQVVVVVDDDPGVRDSLSMLLESVGLNHRLYSNAKDFLDEVSDIPGGCLVLDIRMPGMSGLELQSELRARNILLPIIFITGHGDIGMAVKAMRLGALDFITKPYHEQHLLDRIHEALAYENNSRKQLIEHDELVKRISALSERETEVFERVAAGQANKFIAYDLGISERTVEVHRAQIMKKLGARTLAEVVRIRLESQRPVSEPVVSQSRSEAY
jgi:FixJ family two-component response regulator